MGEFVYVSDNGGNMYTSYWFCGFAMYIRRILARSTWLKLVSPPINKCARPRRRRGRNPARGRGIGRKPKPAILCGGAMTKPRISTREGKLSRG